VRVLAALVLAVFMAGPGLRAECLLLCTKTESAATRSSCHDEPADTSDPAIDSHHDCAAIAPALLTAIKRASAASTVGLVTAVPSVVVASPPAPLDRLVHDPPRFAPPATLLIPLRI
jgi:hypothetical protein